MALRPPSGYSGSAPGASGSAFDVLGHEILAEKAAALGDAGDKAERALVALRDWSGDAEGRQQALKQAARAVHQWFIQRELCGMRRHEGVIRALDIPREVLVRLGAS
jgi:hypothetical protein